MSVLEQSIPLSSPRTSSRISGELIKSFALGFIVAMLIAGVIGALVVFRMAVALNTANTELAAAHSELSSVRSELTTTQESLKSSAPDLQYYRGLYDFCSFVAANMFSMPGENAQSQCMEFATKAQTADWYGQTSMGWTPPAVSDSLESP